MRDTTIFGQILDRALFYHWKLQREGDSENTSSSNKGPQSHPRLSQPHHHCPLNKRNSQHERAKDGGNVAVTCAASLLSLCCRCRWRPTDT